MGTYRRGFQAEAESIAEEVRHDLGIGNIRALDPWTLAKDLDIEAWSLARLDEERGHDVELHEALDVLYAEEQSSLSAVTVFDFTGRRLIIYNESHSRERQVSDLCHELAHSLLLHAPTPALDHLGGRLWDAAMEQEAAYLGGALLIPGKGARYAAKSGLSVERTALKFRCSPEMAEWRLRMSGAKRIWLSARN